MISEFHKSKIKKLQFSVIKSIYTFLNLFMYLKKIQWESTDYIMLIIWLFSVFIMGQ